MRMRGNTIFITGGGSGIGKGLAEAFHQLGNQVIVSGRREEALKKVCDANPGMRSLLMDVTDPASIRGVTARIAEECPDLNCVVNNAGVQRGIDFSDGKPIDDAALEAEIGTNFLGLVRVSSAFLPQLRKRDDATLINVSSGLAFVPLARYPVYCATKAAVHSFSVSLRRQLAHSGIKVIELVPPYVDTELGGGSKNRPNGGPIPMPLDDFIREAMTELATDAEQIAVGPAKNLVSTTATESFQRALAGMNR